MKAPAFQFYVQDFLVGTSHFTAEETGAYIRLLCHQWDNGFIEDDDQKLKKISGISVKKMKNILKKFSKSKPGQLKNLRLEKERKKQADSRKRRSDAGKKGNEEKKKRRKANALRPQSERIELALQSSTSTSVKEGLSAEDREFFRIFRNCAPRTIDDDRLAVEVGLFRAKYPDVVLSKSGPLIGTWVANLENERKVPGQLDPKKTKNAFM